MRRLAVLFVLAFLAGCAAPAATETEGPIAPALGEVLLEPCTEHAADVPVAVAEAQRFLPQGMRPRSIGPTGFAALEVIGVDCESALAGEDGVRVLLAWMLVEPPEELRGDVAAYLYLFAMTTDDAAVASALQALGVPVTVAETTFSTQESPVGFTGRGTAQTEAWSASVDTRVAKREAHRGHPIIRVFVGNATGVTGAVDVDAGGHPHHDAGEGTVTVTGDAPFPAPAAPGIAVYGVQGKLAFLPIERPGDAGETATPRRAGGPPPTLL